MTVGKGRPPKVKKLDDNVTTLKKFLELNQKARNLEKNTFSNPAADILIQTEDDRGSKETGESNTNKQLD